MFQGAKDFLVRKMLQSKLKGVPPEMQEKIITAMNKNPDLFKKIAAETENLVKNGRGQTEAAMLVMKKYQNELQGLLK